MRDDIKVTATKQTARIHLTPEEELTLFGGDPPRWYDHLHAIAHQASLPPAVLMGDRPPRMGRGRIQEDGPQ